MKKMILAAAGLTAVLASCDSGGSAPDGSASGRISSTRTEYSTSGSAPYNFVACDSVTNGGSRAEQTQVAVRFSLAGNIQDVTIGLKGNTSSAYDSNFTTTATGSQLVPLGSNDYKVVFNADSSTGSGLLPQSIVINPTAQKIKVVSVSNKVGSFYAQLQVNTGTSSFTLKDQTLGSIPVYSTCTIISETTEDV